MGESTALAEAVRCGSPVEVLSKRSENTLVFAQPTGGLTAEISAVPVRVHRPDGSWQPVDTTLQRASDGSLGPVASVANVRFSGGGATPLATFKAGGGEVAYSWPTGLPVPAIEGDSAQYAEVFPGVDLRVRALADGFRYVLVVKTVEAAANPALRTVTLNLAASGLTVRPKASGGFDAVDGAGVPAITVGGAAMWDASGLVGSGVQGVMEARSESVPADVDVAELAAETPEGSATAEIAATATATSLVVTPDQAMLSSPETVFPVIIDPVATIDTSNGAYWGYVNSTNATRDDGVARVGVNTDGSGTYRSFWFFPSGTAIGGPATVVAAEVRTLMTHSYDCDNTPVNLWTAGGFHSGKNTWGTPTLGAWMGERSAHAHKGTGQCADDPQSDAAVIFDQNAVKTYIQSAVDAGWSGSAFALSTRQSDGGGEGTASWWKKFDPTKTQLYVQWNHAPATSTAVKVLASGVTDCATSSVPGTNAKRPTFCATPQDVDGGTNRVEFEVWDSAHATRQTYSNGSVTNRTVGSAASWAPPVDLADGVHALRVQSCDSFACGTTWSSWLSFTVDTTPPPVPVIAATSGGEATYQPKSTGNWLGGENVAGNFSFTSSSDAASVEVRLNGSSLGWKTASGGAWTGSVTPPRDGPNTLATRSKDAFGTTSAWSADYVFLVAPAANKSWRWELNDSLSSIDTVGSTVTSPGVQLLSGFTPSPYVTGAGTSKAVTFNGTSQALGTTNTVVNTMASFTVTARVKLGTITPAGPMMTIVSQDGPTGSGFRLQYRTDVPVDGGTRAWCFVMFTADGATDTASTRACLDAQQTTSDWVNLAGVYDAGSHQVQMWIEADGEMVMFDPATAFTNVWSATGALAIGRARQGSSDGQFFNGSIDRVALFATALSGSELNVDKATP
ncbi:hypothetical protein F4553_001962 [Allocatelliglobosispora scoriae]|uniref:LamG-like jellyroll fold domain-containing protein n=1 Tax=Allocatelliglobosispora scoriae TaxID=643052 RepID=A0A841BNQ1_9ACTN|nr:LamG domain-containing protein [Allocatelliglobosispora scoriae]MBB5868583.1 hypothetical protein [Allocatelliglobosispora scoriae]